MLLVPVLTGGVPCVCALTARFPAHCSGHERQYGRFESDIRMPEFVMCSHAAPRDTYGGLKVFGNHFYIFSG